FPGRLETMAWAYERPQGSRGFGFTGGHNHKNWGNENFRRVVVNAILWAAKADVPAGGAKVALDPADLNRNLDYKGKPFTKIEPAK
ncbi:MAG: ThuA domain-containing protein, partial [Fimbriiglobus sp.]